MIPALREKIMREMRSGLHTILILKAIEDLGESYGYEIVKYLERKTGGVIRVKDATVYPVLRYLDRKGVLESFWTEPGRGIPRKYYRLTREGLTLVKDLKKDFDELASTVINIMEVSK